MPYGISKIDNTTGKTAQRCWTPIWIACHQRGLISLIAGSRTHVCLRICMPHDSLFSSSSSSSMQSIDCVVLCLRGRGALQTRAISMNAWNPWPPWDKCVARMQFLGSNTFRAHIALDLLFDFDSYNKHWLSVSCWNSRQWHSLHGTIGPYCLWANCRQRMLLLLLLFRYVQFLRHFHACIVHINTADCSDVMRTAGSVCPLHPHTYTHPG